MLILLFIFREILRTRLKTMIYIAHNLKKVMSNSMQSLNKQMAHSKKVFKKSKRKVIKFKWEGILS